MQNLPDKNNCKKKYQKLKQILQTYDSLLIAFSGGVDSTFLLYASHQILDKNIVAVTSVSKIQNASDINFAKEFTKDLNIKHILIDLKELEKQEFIKNSNKRCYFCKKGLFTELTKIADNLNIKNIAHGANIDDLSDYRPGHIAADEFKIKAPLVEAGFYKKDIRIISKELNLKTYNKPSMACIATRIAYETDITEKKIQMIKQAEEFILNQGFYNCRVRHHGDIAKIELEANEIQKIFTHSIKEKIVYKLKDIGFSHIAIDLEGYGKKPLKSNTINS